MAKQGDDGPSLLGRDSSTSQMVADAYEQVEWYKEKCKEYRDRIRSAKRIHRTLKARLADEQQDAEELQSNFEEKNSEVLGLENELDELYGRFNDSVVDLRQTRTELRQLQIHGKERESQIQSESDIERRRWKIEIERKYRSEYIRLKEGLRCARMELLDTKGLLEYVKIDVQRMGRLAEDEDWVKDLVGDLLAVTDVSAMFSEDSRSTISALQTSCSMLEEELLAVRKDLLSSKEQLRDAEVSTGRVKVDLPLDGLTSRIRNFLRNLDSDVISLIDLAERYRRQGCVDFREHIIGPSSNDHIRTAEAGRFPFRDVWFGRDRLLVCPAEHPGFSEVETVVVDIFHDPPLNDLLTSGDVTQDDIEDLQEEWEDFFRFEMVHVTGTLMAACEDSSRRLVDSVVDRVFRFFGGPIDDELLERYRQLPSECRLGEMRSCGLNRHRSLCFKLACDHFRIPCRLNRGLRGNDPDEFSADAWCIVNLCDRLFFVDLVSRGCLVEDFDISLLCERKHVLKDAPVIDLVHLATEYENLAKEELRRGGFGQVFAVQYGELLIAVKEMNLTRRVEVEGPVANARVRREVTLMTSFRHPHILPTFGSFSFVRQSRLLIRRHRPRKPETIVAIVMPLFDHNGTEFQKLLLKADPVIAIHETLVLLLSVVNGLRYLHNLSILHLDLKPDNILVTLEDDDTMTISDVRICDFGGSRQHCTLMSHSSLPVSFGYCSPEVQRAANGDKDALGEVDETSDVFSLGALLRFYSCFFGSYRQLFSLLESCLSPVPSIRPQLVEIMAILRSHLLFIDQRFQKSRKSESSD